ncbi:amino acid kinase family protein, partial [Vibrio parahaemolyticus EKP-028]
TTAILDWLKMLDCLSLSAIKKQWSFLTSVHPFCIRRPLLLSRNSTFHV